MEDVLELYAQPLKAGRVRLCLDERPCQLLKDVYTPLPMKKGIPTRQDYEYERKGSCVVFMIYDVDRGVRYGKVSQRRTKADYAGHPMLLL